jgi:tRNA(Arg) A34 adenosine deaminase TadA
VFGCSVEAQERITGRSFGITARDILSAGSTNIEVIGPILEEEASAIHREFWKGRRSG